MVKQVKAVPGAVALAELAALLQSVGKHTSSGRPEIDAWRAARFSTGEAGQLTAPTCFYETGPKTRGRASWVRFE